MSEELKSCPFCGNAPIVDDSAGVELVNCKGCGIAFSVDSLDDGALVAGWNRRTSTWINFWQQRPTDGQECLVLGLLDHGLRLCIAAVWDQKVGDFKGYGIHQIKREHGQPPDTLWFWASRWTPGHLFWQPLPAGPTSEQTPAAKVAEPELA